MSKKILIKVFGFSSFNLVDIYVTKSYLRYNFPEPFRELKYKDKRSTYSQRIILKV